MMRTGPAFPNLACLAGALGLAWLAGLPLFAQTQTNAPPEINAPVYLAPTPASPPADVSAAPTQGNAPSKDELDDIRPPYFFLHSWLWLWIALSVAAALALLIALWFWLRPNRQLSPKSAYELALEKLEKARALLREEEPMPYAILVSETIRSYLGQRFQSPSTRRTTEEFLRIMEIDPTSHLAEHREQLRGFLQSCDLVKFARYQPTLAELEQVHSSACGFVTATKPVSVSSHRNGK